MDEDSAKRCLITGAGSGLGRATARGFARLGYRLALIDRDEEGLMQTRRLLRESGATAVVEVADVTDPEQIRQCVDRSVAALGGLDNAVNSAAVEGPRAALAEVDPDLWRRVIEVNLLGVFLSMQAEISHLVAGGGSVVNIGSPAALRAVPGMSGYVASKHALVGLTKSSALEVADRNVRVNLVCPGSFETPMSRRLHDDRVVSDIVGRTPMRRPASLEEVVAPIIWLCSDAASFVTGAVVSVDGGQAAGDVTYV